MEDNSSATQTTTKSLLKTLYVIGTLVLFIFALDLMVYSLKNLGSPAVQTIIQATSNPLSGLFIGLLITAMIQSSSTTTSMSVALVAAGSISLQQAIPIIMGANVGTTITSVLISISFMGKMKIFKRAFTAATFHSIFNILIVLILFPLEYFYNMLTRLSYYLATTFFHPTTTRVESNSRETIPGTHYIMNFLSDIIHNNIVLALLSFALLLASIILFRKLISHIIKADDPTRFNKLFFRRRSNSFASGILTTAAIRSSTITTSLVVPLVAERVIKMSRAIVFIMGANIGTTITAFIAALLYAYTSEGISLAIAHFLFNLIGILLFYAIPPFRKIPLKLARGLAKAASQYRYLGIIYVLLLFFLLPFLMIYLSQL